MAKKILLAHPRFPSETFWSFERALALAGRSATMPPLGLLTVAGLIPREGYEVELADGNLRPIRDDELRDADLVLASAMVVQQDSLIDLVARCRELGTPVVVGGPLVSACYVELQERGFAPDVWFIGEAERVFPEMLKDFERGELKRVYAHVPTEERADALRAAFAGEALQILVESLPELDTSPLPRFDLLELDAYHSMAIQASRGCPIGCEFCDIWVQFGRTPRTGKPQRLLRQFDALLSLGWRGRVFVVDDTFIGKLPAARELVPALSKWQAEHGMPFALCTEADARLGDDSVSMNGLRNGLAAAGFGSVFLGLETPSAESLAGAGKRVNIARDGDVASGLLQRVMRLQASGLEVKAGFIVGFDQDPRDIDVAMIDFISRAAIPLAMVGTLGVLPGTQLQARLVREGRYRGRLEGTQTHGFKLNFTPRGRSERVVLDQYARVLEALYGGKMRSFYQRCEDSMARMKLPPHSGDRLNLGGVRVLLLSLIRLRPRTSYLRFLLRTLCKRPSFLPHAVALAAQGEHLYRLTRNALEEYRTRRASVAGECRAPVAGESVVGASLAARVVYCSPED